MEAYESELQESVETCQEIYVDQTWMGLNLKQQQRPGLFPGTQPFEFLTEMARRRSSPPSAPMQAQTCSGNQEQSTTVIVATTDDVSSATSHDWEGSLLNSYSLTPTRSLEADLKSSQCAEPGIVRFQNGNGLQSPIQPPTLADIQKLNATFCCDFPSRKVSSEGLSALSGQLSGGMQNHIFPDVSPSIDSQSRSHSLYDRRVSKAGSDSVLVTPDKKTNPERVESGIICPESTTHHEERVPTVKRQSIIDAEKWEDRKLESFAKRVGWKQALPRILKNGKDQANRLHRQSQPWRAQPATMRPRESREIVATLVARVTRSS
ncbi:MAG: hypothetical protein Q9162_002158 [Coniocarpon cinnabarinum]